MSFGAPIWFWSLLVIPILIVLFVRSEQQAARKLRDFVSERLLPGLARTVDHRRRNFRFALQLLGILLAIVAVAKPRWGYTFDDAKRKGLDLILVVDTSRSMLSNDVPPSRLQRVKLAAQDLINELQGDRVGLIAFAGRAFLQAPLTIDYDAAVEAINDLDTNTIPEGGTNISEAIELAGRTFGKSAIGNRALIVFTDGEDLNGDSVKAAKAAGDAGVRIFTIGVGTPEGSLIPINGEGGGTAFVKDNNGQIVKSRLDESRLKEIATSTNGFYLHLDDGPRTMKQLYTEGLGKMQAGDIDARLSRRPIERYQWPLGASLLFLTASFMMRERKRVRVSAPNGVSLVPKKSLAVASLLVAVTNVSFGAAPGLDAYRQDKFSEAYTEFEKTLEAHPQSHATDKIQFDAGAAAYKMKDYAKALNSFSQALLSPDDGLQSKSHYNLGNTLYQRGETQKKDEDKLTDWTNALEHYNQSLKITPDNRQAKENLEFVKRKIDELREKQNQQPPPSPSPNPKNDKNDQQQQNKDQQDQKKDQQDQNKDQQDQQNKDQSKQDQKQDKQDQSDEQKQQDQKNEKDQSKEDSEKEKKEEQQPGESPSPSPAQDGQEQQGEASPTPADQGENKKEDQQQKSDNENQKKPEDSGKPSDSSQQDKGQPSPSSSNGEQQGEGTSPSPGPDSSPEKPTGEVKGAGEENQKPNEQNPQMMEAEPEKDGQMSERQAELLLQSMKDEERRVQLDERKPARRVYKDW